MLAAGTRIGGATALALLLMMAPAPSAFAAQAADPPAPLSDGDQLTARPGERLTFTAPPYLPGWIGDWGISKAFVQHGTLRMHHPAITAVATVACDTPPGVYPVGRAMPESEGGPADGHGGDGASWVTVKVVDIDGAERAACPGKVAALPPEEVEEQWPADDSWPQSPWDVRTFQPGDKVTPTATVMGYDEPLTSRGFTGRPVMRGVKAVVTATATIRCDAEPGLYEVRWVGKDEVWARYRVAQIDDATRASCRDGTWHLATGWTPWLVGGAAVALAAAGAYALVRRRRGPARPADSGSSQV
ncbi:hypothetical protein OG594_04815 [Streptomyces sp. NBC_01214]|uniref:hypothetical protein n=1 Tax=Streptomyces sp. NBC_01214 TaxID=2903777 RepID=UPI00224EF793|nr:hypothetical protein [Streptomyces sp. NBC_01214]MCX4800984.1 hypothetical protein [Streptomyces sp. NBC_01214]